MAVRIRLKKIGRKKKPVYRLVVADSRSPRDGRSIEEIGFYDPRQEPALFEFDKERVAHWMSVGAQFSEPVQRLLSDEKVVDKKKHIEGKNFKITKKDRKSDEPEV